MLFTAVVIILAVLTAFRAQLTRVPGGKVLAFFTLCILPALAIWTGLHEQLERSTSTRFCLSCHVMGDFGRSLRRTSRTIACPAIMPASRAIRITRCSETTARSGAVFIMCGCSISGQSPNLKTLGCMCHTTIASVCTVTSVHGRLRRLRHIIKTPQCSRRSKPISVPVCPAIAMTLFMKWEP